MFLLDTDKAQAVFFFGKDHIAKELLYPELEALLDGYVPLTEWANTTQDAVYIEFDNTFCVTAAVFFLMGFDSKGAVDANWNLPLFDMARTTARGPDLGAGPIKLVTASQCPIAFFKNFLWDPDLRPQGSHFKQIQRALKRNRLGVHFRSASSLDQAAGGISSDDFKRLEKQFSQQFAKQYETALRDQMANLLEGQRQRMDLLMSDRDQALQKIQGEYETKLRALQAELESERAGRESLEIHNQALTQNIEGLKQKIEGLREYYEHKLRRTQSSESDTIEKVQMRLARQMQSEIEKATAEISEVLKMREVELSYRIDREEQLLMDIQRLRREHQDALLSGSEIFLERLSRNGINFVTYQPGAGHITIPYAEISVFMENPYAFTANYCGVTEECYLAWLRHYQTPVCSAVDENGEMCCANLARVTNPAEFVPGEQDVCEQHKKRARHNKLKVI